MARILEKTNLFLGLDFQTAVAVYRRVLEEAHKLVGPAPNHDASRVLCHREGTSFHRWAVKEREDLRERDGYLLEEFPFLDFFIAKGNSASEFCLLREKLFPQSWSLRDCIARVNISGAKTAADVAESLLGHIMEMELNSLVPEAADYAVFVRDIYKIGGYTRRATSMAGAMEVKQSLGKTLQDRERGNVVTEATVEVYRRGVIEFPPYGQPRFRPFPGGARISDQRFDQIVATHAAKQSDIRFLWGHIVAKYNFFTNGRFEFDGVSYVVNANPGCPREPESSQISRHYVGSRSNVDLFDALDSGLLREWADSLGW